MCLCGDTQCPSCGPAQGNWRCPICRAWADDGCDHITSDGEGIKLEYVELAGARMRADDTPEPGVSPFVEGVE